jgi:hypothetical protein
LRASGKFAEKIYFIMMEMGTMAKIRYNNTELEPELKRPVKIPNEETVEAIVESHENLKRYTSSQDMFDDILNENK